MSLRASRGLIRAVFMRRHFCPASPWLATALALAGCGGEPPLLAEMAAFHGDVRIEIRDATGQRTLAGELEFDAARFRWASDGEGKRTEFVREGAGTVKKLVDGRPTGLALQDEADFALLWSVVRSELPAGAGTRRWDGGYAAEIDGRTITVTWTGSGG